MHSSNHKAHLVAAVLLHDAAYHAVPHGAYTCRLGATHTNQNVGGVEALLIVTRTSPELVQVLAQ
jgi:hypothetical protein